MFLQLSACRKSGRKPVIRLQNNQGSLKPHYWPNTGNTTKPNIIPPCWKESALGKSWWGFFSIANVNGSQDGHDEEAHLFNNARVYDIKTAIRRRRKPVHLMRFLPDVPGNINRWWQSKIKRRWLLTCQVLFLRTAVTGCKAEPPSSVIGCSHKAPV